MRPTNVEATILLVDDDPRIARLLRATLQEDGFEVLVARDGAAGVAMVESEQPDLVVLDVAMPVMDGMRSCQRIREFSTVPIIMLTGQASEADILRGFSLGVDDYMTKPFSPGELVARIRAVLGRARRAHREVALVFDDGVLRIDLASRAISARGEPVTLPRTEFRLLMALAESADRVLLHDELKRRVWGDNYAASDEQLRTSIKYLRRRIEPEPTRPRYLITQRGIGYLFRAPRAPE
ncbi:MAG: response regulator transcription factor [Chloroflexota bacterium]|nr:MAG: response regulator transcription factor [Chloroflexota bacterium]